MALRVALILGAGPNVGINVAKAFAAQGYKVAIVSRSRKDNEDTRQFSQVQADFGDPTSIKDIFATVTRELGHPSVVVYNEYKTSGYKFYFADQRKSDGSPVYGAISGPAHGSFHTELAAQQSQGPWNAIFVKDQG
ncbi:uncharacterized protein TRIREDRAFT_104060 [Trichoderma reesei QM6a]|uniref:Predicted protein n=2 Tax=Hypocrea jecorina TaxID=51453 RepID=G0RB69_HYPJQ|nr:uncharacterized protein TRIREDRAFT_104060 [Trichoderma reesei QM6a]EGR51305.1 predicted protein [Trichoderma reesei QM6a]ETS04883.1 hypothetical protein M419DRAFT_127991 [Trichoderma reesei RUT C-30]